MHGLCLSFAWSQHSGQIHIMLAKHITCVIARGSTTSCMMPSMTPATIGFNLLPVCCKSGSAFACNQNQQSRDSNIICYSIHSIKSTTWHQMLLIGDIFFVVFLSSAINIGAESSQLSELISLRYTTPCYGLLYPR